MGKTYECVMCQNTYEQGWTDEEAIAEFEQNFGRKPTESELTSGIVCDDCYKVHLEPAKQAEEVYQKGLN